MKKRGLDMNSNIFNAETTAMDMRKNVLYEGAEILKLFNDPSVKAIIDESCGELYTKSIKNFDKLNNLEYNVGVGAVQSAGKSAVLNATVLGYPLLPFCNGSTTCVPTIIKYGKEVKIEISIKDTKEDKSGKETKSVIKEKRKLILPCSSIAKALFDKMLLYFTKCHTVLALDNVGFFTKEHIDVYGSEINPDDLKLASNNSKHIAMLMCTVLCAYVNQNVNEEELDARWIEAQNMQHEILRDLGLNDDEKFYTVTVYWDAPLLEKGLVFYDLPGLGSNNTTNKGYLSHEQITKVTLNDVQTAIYLFKPEATLEGIDVIRSFLNSDVIRELKSKNERVIAAVNKIDLVRDVAGERAVDDAKTILNKYLQSAKVHKISAQSYGDYTFLKKGIIELHNTGYVINEVKPRKLERDPEGCLEEVEDNYKDYPMTEFLETLDNLAERAIYTNILGFIRSIYELLLNVERYAKNRIDTIEILQDKIDESTKAVIRKLQKMIDDSSGEVQEVIKKYVDKSLSEIEDDINFNQTFNGFISKMEDEMSSLKYKCTDIRNKLTANWVGDIVISRRDGQQLVQPNYDNWTELKAKVRQAKFDDSFLYITHGFKDIITKIQDKCSGMNTPAKEQYEKILNAVLKDIDSTILSETSKLNELMENEGKDKKNIDEVKKVIFNIGNQLKNYVSECLEDIKFNLNNSDDITELNIQLTDMALEQQEGIETEIQIMMKEKTDALPSTGVIMKSTGLIGSTTIDNFFVSAFNISDSWIESLKAGLNPENLVATYVFNAKQAKKLALLNPAMNLNEKVEKLSKDLESASGDDIINYGTEIKLLLDVLKKMSSELDRGIKMENIINGIRIENGYENELKNVENVKFAELKSEIEQYINREKGDK